MMNKLMLSCHKATELIEKESIVKLTLMEMMQLKAHKLLCSGCKAYEVQSKLLDGMLLKKLSESNDMVAKLNNPELKDKILEKISQL